MINALLLGLERYIKIFIQDFIFDINNIFIQFTDVHESLYCICKVVKWKFLLLSHHELRQESKFPQCPTLVYCCESGTAIGSTVCNLFWSFVFHLLLLLQRFQNGSFKLSF